MINPKPQRPPKVEAPPLVIINDGCEEDSVSDFWWNKFMLCLTIILGMILGYSIGINMG